MLFLFKYIDDLIGKGFEWYVIMQLLWYASATNVAMALPLSMLLSSIMTFGNLGESYELVAIKAAGISLRKAMMPLIVFVMLFSTGAFFFSDYMLPIANLKMGSLLYDVRQKKADFLITEGVFNNSIPNYSIRAMDKSNDGTRLYDLTIYEHAKGSSGTNVLMAEEGKMYDAPDPDYMILELKNGVRYEEQSGSKVYNPRQLFTRYYFEQTEQRFDMSAFQMTRTDENLFKSHYAMLNLRQLDYYADSIQNYNDSLRNTVIKEILPYYRVYNQYQPVKIESTNPVTFQNSTLEIIPEESKTQAVTEASNQVRYIQDVLNLKATADAEISTSIRRYLMEYQRKFTLSVVCLVFFSIGAPLGAIIRKGGLGLPVVMAIIFFLIYYVISTLAEKSAREGNIDTTLGMWTAIIVLAPLGVFLTYKAATDSALFDIEQYKTIGKKLLGRIQKPFKRGAA